MQPEIRKILEGFPPNKKHLLLPILLEIQNTLGFLDNHSLEAVGEYVNIPSNQVYGVATFYDQFRFKAKGKFHIKVCEGTTCHLYGASTILKELERQLRIRAGQTSRDGKFSLEVVTCVGACHQAPVILINEIAYPLLKPTDLNQIIRSLTE